MTAHDLKTDMLPFIAVLEGRKRFELRKDDRGFCVGDDLWLREQDGLGEMTGRVICAHVSYVLRGGPGGYGLPPGYCVMSLTDVTEMEDDAQCPAPADAPAVLITSAGGS